MGGNDFLQGMPLLLEGRNFISKGDKHIPVFDEIRAVADRPMSRNDDGLVRDPGEIGFGGLDHAVDGAAGRVVNERVIAIPPGICDVENIRVREVDGDVAIGMGRRIVL